MRINLLINIFTLLWCFPAFAQFDPGTAIFIMNSVSDLKTVVDTIKVKDEALPSISKSNDGHTISIPVEQDDGSYINMDIGYTESDGTRTITIPGRGDISLIEDADGNYSFELTPEQIKGASNITCNVGIDKTGTCTIKPFVTMLGDKILTADQLVLDYKQGGNLVVAGGQASNLKLTDENSQTGFYNSQTDGGDASIGLTFSQQEGSSSGLSGLIPTPPKFEDQKYLKLDVDTSKMIHTVRNPDDPSQTAEKFAVKDGGVSTSLIFSRDDHLNINIAGTTHSGVRYNSNPFSDHGVKVDTNSPLSVNLSIDNNPKSPKTSLSLGMMGKDSKATIVDNRDPKKTDTITASGNTFLNLSQAVSFDEKSGKMNESNSPVAFELGSESISVVNQHTNGKESTALLKGIQASGTVNPSNDHKDITMTADSFDLMKSNDGKLEHEIGLSGNIQALMQEEDKTKKYQGMTDHAYYNNGESTVNLSGGTFISFTEYKKGSTESFNGKQVDGDAFAFAQSGTVTSNGTVANIDGGITFRQIEFEDHSTLVAVNGDQAQVDNSEYGVKLDQGFNAVSETDSNGDIRAAHVSAADAQATDIKNGDTLGVFNSTTTAQLIPNDNGGKDTLIANHTSEVVVYQSGDAKNQAQVNGLKANVLDDGGVKYGTATFDNAIIKSDSAEVKIVGVNAVIYSDDEIKQGEIDIQNISLNEKDYSVDIIAKGLDGTPGKFKVTFFEDADGRSFNIFGEDGKRVQLSALNKDGNYTQALFETVQYLETDSFKSAMATNLSGTFENTRADDGRLQTFKFDRVSGVQRIDDKFSQVLAENGKVTQMDNGTQTDLEFESAFVTDQSIDGARYLSGAVLNGTIEQVEYRPGSSSDVTSSASLSFGSAIGAQMEGIDGKDITVFKANDVEIVAVDYDAMVNASGKIGELNFYEDSKIQSIEAKDLRDFNIKDDENGILARLDGDKILRVVERDDTGKEIGSYLLMNTSTLDITDKNNGIHADIRIGVLEFAQDKVNNQNIILEADISGRVKVDKTKSPVKAEVNFALKGKNLITKSHSVIRDDGKTIEKTFSIIALGDKGRLDNLELSAGPSFLKNAISLQAKGSEAGGKELTFTFRQDKAKGTYFLRAEFKEGDKIKVKLFPFTLESKKEGSDAVAEILLTPKGQNYMNHMQIISNVVSAREITDWLDISDGGMIIAHTGTLGGFGFEMMFQNKNYFNPSAGMDFTGQADIAASYGLGIFHKNDKGDRTSVGMMLTGDSELEYQTNGRGVLKIFGVDMDKKGSLPTTVNLYMKKEWRDGDALYAGIFADGASYMVDETTINNDARFFEGGRTFGKTGGTISYSKKFGNDGRLTFTAGANNDFKDPAFCVSYTQSFGGSSVGKKLKSTMSDTMLALNQLPSNIPSYRSGPTLKGAIRKLQREVNKQGLKYDQVLAFERVEASLSNTISAIKDNSLTEKNYRDVFKIDSKDLKKIKDYELLSSSRANVAEQLENLNFVLSRELTRKSQINKLKQRESSILSAMDKLTYAFEHESSSEDVLKVYKEKVESLAELRNNS